MLILFVGWGIYFVYVLIRFRAGANPKASYEGAHSHFSSYVEVSVAVIEVVLLVGFAIPAWTAWVTPPDTPAGETFEVRVVAQQFAWNVHYPGPDGVFGRTDINLVDDIVQNPVGLDRSDPAARDDIIAINQLNFPVDTDVIVYLSSRDVLHGFSLPQMRVKQDAVPGMMIPCTSVPCRRRRKRTSIRAAPPTEPVGRSPVPSFAGSRTTACVASTAS